MQLMNQSNQNSTSINNVIDMVKRSGMTPQQIVTNLIQSGKITNAQLEEAKRKASEFLNR